MHHLDSICERPPVTQETEKPTSKLPNRSTTAIQQVLSDIEFFITVAHWNLKQRRKEGTKVYVSRRKRGRERLRQEEALRWGFDDDPLLDHHLRQRRPTVPHRADVRQVRAPLLRRHPGGVDGLYDVLPSGALGQLPLRARHHHLAWSSPAGRAPPGGGLVAARAVRARRSHPRAGRGVGASHRRKPHLLAFGLAAGGGGTAVLCG